MAQQEYQKYYVPESSPWPIVGAVALFLIAVGAANFTVEMTKGKEGFGGWILFAGIAMLIFMVTGWFRNQIHESMSGLFSDQLGRSYRQGMAWFIFSEIMFFAAFFGLPFGTFWLAATSNSVPDQANVRSNANASNEAALIEQLLCKVKALAAGFSINPAPKAQRP